MEDNDVAIRAMVLSGARPAITESDDCPSQVTSLIKVCWAQKPDQRLDFRGVCVCVCVCMHVERCVCMPACV